MTITGKIDYKTLASSCIAIIVSMVGWWLTYGRYLPTEERVSQMIIQESQRDVILNNLSHSRAESDRLSITLEKTNIALLQLTIEVTKLRQQIDDMKQHKSVNSGAGN